MEWEKIDIPFYRYWKSIIYYKLLNQKSMQSSAKLGKNHLSLSNFKNYNESLIKIIIPSVFSGFSIMFIGLILLNILTNYPPKIISISP